MFSVWDIQGQPAHHDWTRVNRVLGAHKPNAYDEDAIEHEAEYHPPTGGASRGARAWAEAVEKPVPTQAEPARLARQIMTSPVRTLFPDDTVAEAWAIMKIARFRHLPVINEARRLVGIISDRDLLAVAGTPDEHPLTPVQGRPVSSIMATSVVSADPDTPIRDLAEFMVSNKIGCVPITGCDHAVLGIVSRGDVLQTLVTGAPLELWI